jgi:hypothetical protein
MAISLGFVCLRYSRFGTKFHHHSDGLAKRVTICQDHGWLWNFLPNRATLAEHCRCRDLIKFGADVLAPLVWWCHPAVATGELP